MTRRKPTFILADAAGLTQFALVAGTIEDAQRQAQETAVLMGQPVVIYSVTHIATYGPKA